MQSAANLDELRKKAAKFMLLEELREFRNQARAEASGEKGKDEKDRQGGQANAAIYVKIIGEADSENIPPDG